MRFARAGILANLLAVWLVPMLATADLQAQSLEGIAREINARRLRVSSGLFDPESNLDALPIPPGETLTNESDKPVEECYFYVDWLRFETLPRDALYFHARYRQEFPVAPFSPYTIAEIRLGEYPQALDELLRRPSRLQTKVGQWPYVSGDRIPLDPWGQPFQFARPGVRNPQGFDVWSFHGNSRAPAVWIGNWEHR